MLLAALKRDNANLDEHPEEYFIALSEMLAIELEAQAPSNTAKLVRSLAYNLQQNDPMRQELLSGVVTAKEVCSKSSAEWAPAQLKRAREAAAERVQERLRVAKTGGELYSLTKSVRCEECGSRWARFKHLGTDMKDWHGRKNEVWGTKHDDDDGQRDCFIECVSCNHSWHGTAPEVHYPEDGDDLEEPRRKDATTAARAARMSMPRVLGCPSPDYDD